MTDLEELIASAERLCNSLDASAENEKAFSLNVCAALERFSWDMLRMSNDLRQIKDYCEG